MRGIDKLKGVKQPLISLAYDLDKVMQQKYGIEVTVAEGLRTLERQKQLVKEKKSKTLNSRHLSGDAIDIYPVAGGKILWDKFDILIKEAKALNSKDFTYGYDWGWDKPHIEIKK